MSFAVHSTMSLCSGAVPVPTCGARPEHSGAVGFAPGTRIATPRGFCPVERLRAGDLVLTRDNGLRPLLWTHRTTGPGAGETAPVDVAAGTFGNARRICLARGHHILLRHPTAALHFGEEEVLVPVEALVGAAGVRLRPKLRAVWHHLLLSHHEVLFVEGAAAESLWPGAAPPPPIHAPARARLGLSLSEGRLLAALAGQNWGLSPRIYPVR